MCNSNVLDAGEEAINKKNPLHSRSLYPDINPTIFLGGINDPPSGNVLPWVVEILFCLQFALFQRALPKHLGVSVSIAAFILNT